MIAVNTEFNCLERQDVMAEDMMLYDIATSNYLCLKTLAD